MRLRLRPFGREVSTEQSELMKSAIVELRGVNARKMNNLIDSDNIRGAASRIALPHRTGTCP
jgi:hypothetical protein